MTPVNSKDFNIALQVLTNAFRENPSVLWVAKQDDKILDRIAALCKFCLTTSVAKKGAFLSSDQKGVSLIFKNDVSINPFAWLRNYFLLGQNCIGWDRAWAMIQREKEVTRRRPKVPHLYFWMLAVEDQSNGLNTIIELRDHAFQMADEMKLPILAETSMKRTLNMYLRYGFELYDTWDTGKDGILIYFIRRGVRGK